ncbi:small GTPase Cdc42 [Favolaschia claudopus]|uniref:Small GTPase Cdc42 n=1 Tax=Favolaschia claudopus TaxID=2862362 RepID=A0AAW0CKQ8_9AGAR
MSSNPQPVMKKLVVLGDGAVGKSSLIVSRTTGGFPQHYVPTACDIQETTGTTNTGETCRLSIWDTAGGEDYDRLRPLSYPLTDIFLICFAVTSHIGFLNIRDRWVPEVRHYCPNVPFLVVGTQIDLREDPTVLARLAERKLRVVDTEEGRRLAHEVGAAKYVECSALTHEGLSDVFDEAALAILKFPVDQPRTGARCSVL